MEIYFHPKIPKLLQYKLSEAFPTDNIHYQDNKPDFEQTQIIVGNVPCEWLGNVRNLKLIQTDSAGVDNYLPLDWQELSNQSVVLGNIGDFYTIPVAEEAISAMLYFLRAVPQIKALQTQKLWDAPKLRATKRTLSGKTVTILGYGNIGKMIHQMLGPFSCEVMTFRSSALEKQEKLCAAIAKSDILVSTIPFTKKNHNFLNYAMLEKLGPDGIFINVGRGSTVDEAAIYSLVSSGKIAGAYLDVTSQEPLPKDSPLWDEPNIVLSQHSASSLENEDSKKVDLLIEAIQYFKTHNKPMFPIPMTKD